MTLAPRFVMIPVVKAGSDGGVLLQVIASNSPREVHEKRLNPMIAHLLQYKLFKSGEAALTALRRLRLISRQPAYRRLLGQQQLVGYLEVADGRVGVGLSEETSRSAELGLALALLLFAAQSRMSSVFATGALSSEGAGAASFEHGVPVAPVAMISQKLAAIRASLDAEGGSIPKTLLLPKETVDGRSTLEVHGSEIKDLIAAFHGRKRKLEVHAVATLEEAARVLGITSLVMGRAQRRRLAAVSAAVLAASFGIASWLWLSAPIPLAWATVAVQGAGDVATPLRVRYAADGALVRQPDCFDEERVRRFGKGDRIVLAAEVVRPERLAPLLGGYHFAVLGVGETGGVKEFHDREMRVSTERGSPRLSIEVLASDGTAERTRIIVLARRAASFDRVSLRDGVRATLAAAPAGEKINAATGFLVRQAPGFEKLDIRTVSEEVACAEPASSR